MDGPITRHHNIGIDALDRLTSAEMRELPTRVLHLLQTELGEVDATQKARKAVLWAALNERFAENAAAKRKAKRADTGVVHIFVDGFDIEAEAKKKVEWDQTLIRDALGRMTKEDREFYAQTKIAVPEKLYAGAPPLIKALLEPARTVKPEKETFKIEPVKQGG